MSVERKKARLSSEEVPESSTTAICGHWVKRKKRFCKMTVAKGRSHCGEHEPSTANTTTSQGMKDDERIPCPLDGKHTVYRNKLKKHLTICNAKPKEDESFIVKEINAGEINDDEGKTEDCTSLRLNELPDEEFYGVIEKVKELHKKYVEGRIEKLEVKHKSLDAELAKEDYGKETRKHLLQASSLLGILETEGQLQNDTSFIEFGAGKGQLAYFLAQVLGQQLEGSQVVLLDRMSLRHKKDNKIDDRSLVHRIRADIADFCMPRLDLLKSSKNAVAVSKHLCGAATDLTLRCITQAATISPESPFITDFVLIALCCHHRCEWRSFVGKEFFRAHSISVRQFVVMTKMVSWAICGTGMSRERRRLLVEQEPPQVIENNESTKRLSLVERESVGLMCKRVLDHARLEFLRQHGYDASLKYYVSRDVTLENVCLLAKKAK